LLVRSKRGVVPTQAGKQLLVHARELLQLWEGAKGSALASSREVQGLYTIGCHASVALYSLGAVLPRLMEEHPRLEIKLQHDLSRKITEAVIRMEIDVAIVVNPVKHPDLVIRRLCTDEVSFWVGPGKRAIQDFRSGEGVLICEPDLIQTKELIKKLKKRDIAYRRIVTTSNLEVVTDLVAKGAGIGVIPERVALARKDVDLKRLPKAPVFHDEICLLYRVENRSVRSIQVISEAVAKAFS
jgi:DNA-binding transcriptional LysR family regulator